MRNGSMLRKAVFATLVLLCESSLGAGAIPTLEQWERVAPPQDEHERWGMASHGDAASWRVSLTSGEVQVEPFVDRVDWDALPAFARPSRRARAKNVGLLVAHEVADGYLFGSDAGEWGGSAWWTDRKGNIRYSIGEGNFIGFATLGEGVVAVSGLAHLTSRVGALHFLERQDGRWREVRKIDLGGAAYAFMVESEGSIVVVTSNGLVRYSDGAVRPIVPAKLEMSAPNSLVKVGEKFFVGMNGAVAEFAPGAGGFIETWLRPAPGGGLRTGAGSE